MSKPESEVVPDQFIALDRKAVRVIYLEKVKLPTVDRIFHGC